MTTQYNMYVIGAEYKAMVVYERDRSFSVSLGSEEKKVLVTAKLVCSDKGLKLTAQINKIYTTSSVVMQDPHTLHLFTAVSIIMCIISDKVIIFF